MKVRNILLLFTIGFTILLSGPILTLLSEGMNTFFQMVLVVWSMLGVYLITLSYFHYQLTANKTVNASTLSYPNATSEMKSEEYRIIFQPKRVTIVFDEVTHLPSIYRFAIFMVVLALLLGLLYGVILPRMMQARLYFVLMIITIVLLYYLYIYYSQTQRLIYINTPTTLMNQPVIELIRLDQGFQIRSDVILYDQDRTERMIINFTDTVWQTLRIYDMVGRIALMRPHLSILQVFLLRISELMSNLHYLTVRYTKEDYEFAEDSPYQGELVRNGVTVLDLTTSKDRDHLVELKQRLVRWYQEADGEQ